MVKDTIQAVKEAEQKAAQIVAEASEKGRIQIEEAEREAVRRREEALRQAKEENTGLLTRLSAEGEQYLAESMKSVERDIASLKEHAGNKADAVIGKIISELI